MSKVDTKFCLDLGPLSPETEEVAKRELRETPELREESCAELRKLLRADESLFYRDDDEFLTIFLRPCKWYPQSAYELMKRIAQFKKDNAHLLKDLMPEDEKVAFTDHNVVNVLVDRDQRGRRILIVNCGGSWDPSKVSADQLFRIFYLIHEAAVMEQESQVNGVVVVMDFDDLGMKQVRAFNLAFSMRLLSFIQDAMPLRLKEVHMVKQPFIFNMIWTLFKPFIREKLKNRIFFHGTKMSSFHKYISPDHLPKNYGGTLPEIDYSGKDWYPAVLEHEDHIRKFNSYGFANKDVAK